MIRGYSAIGQEYIYDWLAHSEDIGVFNIDLVFLHKSTNLGSHNHSLCITEILKERRREGKTSDILNCRSQYIQIFPNVVLFITSSHLILLEDLSRQSKDFRYIKVL